MNEKLKDVNLWISFFKKLIKGWDDIADKLRRISTLHIVIARKQPYYYVESHAPAENRDI